MNRRNFVRSAALAGAALPLKASLMDNARSTKHQWYELRTYTFADAAQRTLTSTYLESALIPALNRAGCANIGVFTETLPQPGANQPRPAAAESQPGAAQSQPAAAQPQPAAAQSQPAAASQAQPESTVPKTYVLIPFDSIDTFTTLNEKLARDKSYTEAAAPYLDAPATAPAYQRIESSLFRAFAHMPHIEVPEKKPRLFELRRYESPTESAGQKKIEMFNDAGEIDIFKKIGARPVFFGETIIGTQRPNLTYMLCFDNMEAHDARWKAFGSDPEWKKISSQPEYSDALLISKIVRTFLIPAAYSQL
jgi:hypothetical protein